jgi:hypothetical protein
MVSGLALPAHQLLELMKLWGLELHRLGEAHLSACQLTAFETMEIGLCVILSNLCGLRCCGSVTTRICVCQEETLRHVAAPTHLDGW